MTWHFPSRSRHVFFKNRQIKIDTNYEMTDEYLIIVVSYLVRKHLLIHYRQIHIERKELKRKYL